MQHKYVEVLMPYRINARPAQAPEPETAPTCGAWEREQRLAGLALRASVFLALAAVTLLSALMAALCIAVGLL